MTAGNETPPTSNPITLVRQMVSAFVELGKLEVQRGRQEITEQVLQYRAGVVLLAVAFGFVLLAVFVLMILLVLAIAALTGLPGWVVALFVLIILIAVAGIFAWRGIVTVQSTHFTPDETVEAVKEDIAWAKRLLRRG
jgi:uncharacterized membrane protein YqjE